MSISLKLIQKIQTNNWEPAESGFRLEDYFSLMAVLVSAGSVFLPWFQIDLNASFSIYQSSVDLGKFNGAFVLGGRSTLLISTIGILMLFFRVRWAFLAGLLNLTLGISYLTGWLDFSNELIDKSGKIGSLCCKLNPQYGLYLFIFASFFWVISLIQSERAYREFLQRETLS